MRAKVSGMNPRSRKAVVTLGLVALVVLVVLGAWLA
ncbi:Uncharacterised protein [Mycobacteroides abscessus subsp. abscessus]|nr:Uncharacterised protein [Mycobacteroides abscessus subsp. abscessus]